MMFVAYDVCRLMMFVAYNVCRIMTFVGYDVCGIMMFVAYDIFVSLIVFVAVPNNLVRSLQHNIRVRSFNEV